MKYLLAAVFVAFYVAWSCSKSAAREDRQIQRYRKGGVL